MAQCRRGFWAERVAGDAAGEAVRCLRTDEPVGWCLAEQLVLPIASAAVATGHPGRFRIGPLAGHPGRCRHAGQSGKFVWVGSMESVSKAG